MYNVVCSWGLTSHILGLSLASRDVEENGLLQACKVFGHNLQFRTIECSFPFVIKLHMLHLLLCFKKITMLMCKIRTETYNWLLTLHWLPVCWRSKRWPAPMEKLPRYITRTERNTYYILLWQCDHVHQHWLILFYFGKSFFQIQPLLKTMQSIGAEHGGKTVTQVWKLHLLYLLIYM